ncbi:MAG: 16S rRNA (guanine(966)-N(2))-methyltransferase RsmD [Clostridia bacterium]|nr:16S rRNA (guanine(966)-N(2))-methyltransferase RsmD [Clostridia bacterium]
MKFIKIASGKSKGLNLISEKNDNLRPTKDRVKEALFNIIQFDINGKNFLDLFGGTGQIGIEAFSRHAGKVTIVDNNSESIKLIKANVSKIKAPHENIKIVKSDALYFLKSTNEIFDIVFLDPPYSDTDLLVSCLNMLPNLVAKNAIIITETIIGESPQNFSTYYSLKKTYKYGKMCLNLYKNIGI